MLIVPRCLQTLYTYPESFRASKALIAAKYSGVEVRVVCEPPEFELGKTNKTEEFLAKFPLGKVCINMLRGTLLNCLFTRWFNFKFLNKSSL